MQGKKWNICKKRAVLVWRALAKHNKLLLSFLYFVVATFTHALNLIFTNNKVPNRESNPPLPDIFLDNFDYVPWAMSATETLIVYEVSTMLVVLIFHKYRFIVLRRGFVLIASIYLLRCVTTFVTTLPPPSTHIICRQKMKYTLWPMTQRVFSIMFSFGLYIVDGQPTCGDYIFSGHTAILTFMSFGLRKYTSNRFYSLHILTWICNIGGMFLILAAHEHYTVDVIISFYVVQQLFTSYHVFARDKSVNQTDYLTGMWRPLFVFFESDLDRVVPNEFENPFPRLKTLPNFRIKGIRKVI